MKKLMLMLTFLIAFLFSKMSVHAQMAEGAEETLEAQVLSILEEKTSDSEFTQGQITQKLELRVSKGSLKDQTIYVETGTAASAGVREYKVGDRLIVSFSKDIDGNNQFIVTDVIRRQPMLWLFILFIFIVVAVGKWWGVSSLVGMIFSFVIIFKLILPQIMAGTDPIMIAIVGSCFIIPVTFALSHGWNKKTVIAIVGTLISLVVTGGLAIIFVNAARLTGFASEEAMFLQYLGGGNINMKGLLLAGIIIGALGILDDITVSQASIVNELKKANPKMKFGELYSRAMAVGQDHISSMVNTLILVYTGASLPLLLLFIDNPQPFSQVINYELIADEIVRTLVGSIGLVLAVPITTAIAAREAVKKN